MNQAEYNDSHIIMLESGTPVVALDVKEMGYACDTPRAMRWQDGHRQIVLGIKTKYSHFTINDIIEEFYEITGHEVSYTTIFHWLTKFAVMEVGFDTPKNVSNYRTKEEFGSTKAIKFIYQSSNADIARGVKYLAYKAQISYHTMRKALAKVRKDAKAMHSPVVRKSK